jgi:hypothetical protein
MDNKPHRRHSLRLARQYQAMSPSNRFYSRFMAVITMMQHILSHWNIRSHLRIVGSTVSETEQQRRVLGLRPGQIFSFTAVMCLLLSLATKSYLFEQAAFGSLTGAITNTIWRMIMQWILRAYDLVFGCRHPNLSRVFSIERASYKVCCQCGARFPYSWELMCIIKGKERKPRPELVHTRTELVQTTADGS